VPVVPLPHPRRWPSHARRITRPIIEFLHVEAAAGVALLVATAVALLWGNLPWSESYHSLWSRPVSFGPGSWTLSSDLHGLVNDGLMALFFFVVGLEIKREWVSGELRDRRAAVLPAAAALGGMAVPALLYTAINLGSGFTHGWGVPMATDIAFAVGVLALLGPRVPTPLRVFVLTLAIVDDIGAIVVIALFYGTDVDGRHLVLAVALAALAALLWRWRSTSWSGSGCGWPCTRRASTPPSRASCSASSCRRALSGSGSSASCTRGSASP
jgi:Na+:H+ antiporter, NhaA family